MRYFIGYLRIDGNAVSNLMLRVLMRVRISWENASLVYSCLNSKIFSTKHFKHFVCFHTESQHDIRMFSFISSNTRLYLYGIFPNKTRTFQWVLASTYLIYF